MQFPQKEVHNKQYLFALIIAGTILGLAGTDLVLPAVPTLPEYIKGTLSQAQLVLAAFTGGTAIGLLVFGELGARYDKKVVVARHPCRLLNHIFPMLIQRDDS